MSESPLTPGNPYAWGEPAVPYTNKTDHWIVVVGASVGNVKTDNVNIISVLDQSGNVIDSVTSGFVTSGLVNNAMPRRMLVPPRGQVTSTGGVGQISIVECLRLKDAKDWI